MCMFTPLCIYPPSAAVIHECSIILFTFFLFPDAALVSILPSERITRMKCPSHADPLHKQFKNYCPCCKALLPLGSRRAKVDSPDSLTSSLAVHMRCLTRVWKLSGFWLFFPVLVKDYCIFVYTWGLFLPAVTSPPSSWCSLRENGALLQQP